VMLDIWVAIAVNIAGIWETLRINLPRLPGVDLNIITPPYY